MNFGDGAEENMNTKKVGIRFNKLFKISFLVILFIVVFGFLIYFLKDKVDFGWQKDVGLSGYQAVFISNGQVYFGKLSNKGDTYVALKDVYYLQTNQQLQLGQESGEADKQLSLVKLGNELHSPDDRMYINRDQILFYEDLKSNGRVVEAILKYQKNNIQKIVSPSVTTSY